MATLERCNSKLIPSLKKAATTLIAVGFFAATLFLAVGLWLPANAAPASTATEVQSSLLLALDKPQAPLPKLRLAQMSSTVDQAEDTTAAIVSQDLATELNDWTYTASGLGSIVSIFDSVVKTIFAIELNLIKSELSFWAGVLQIAGLPNQQYLNAIAFIQDAINALFAPISPAH
jgi:hypothetical protein